MSDSAEQSKKSIRPGRPEEYDPAYCEAVVEYGRRGKSKTWIAAKLGVARRTLYLWEEAHPEFMHAMALAKTLEQQWWEEEGQECLRLAGFQASMWSRSMAARFPDEWREKVAHVGGDKGDEPIRNEVTVSADAFTSSIVGLAARAAKNGETSDSGT